MFKPSHRSAPVPDDKPPRVPTVPLSGWTDSGPRAPFPDMSLLIDPTPSANYGVTIRTSTSYSFEIREHLAGLATHSPLIKQETVV